MGGGIGLMAQAGAPPEPKHSQSTKTLDAVERPARVFDYLATEVFARVDPRTRDVLLRTAIPPSVTASAAVGLTGRQNASQILDELSRHQYFTTRYATADDAAYRYAARRPWESPIGNLVRASGWRGRQRRTGSFAAAQEHSLIGSRSGRSSAPC